LTNPKKGSPQWPQGVKVKPALEQAYAAMARANLVAVAGKSGCQIEEGNLVVPLFNRTYVVHPADAAIGEIGSASIPQPEVQLIILHYLLNADGIPPAGIWITFRHIPDALVFGPRFDAIATEPLVRAFGSDMERFSRAAQTLGGMRMTRTGDASFRFIALPQIPMGCTLYVADEEMAASASILFDAVVPNYLCAEDVAFLGIHLSDSLLKAAALS
jgi:hypothetical protein